MASEHSAIRDVFWRELLRMNRQNFLFFSFFFEAWRGPKVREGAQAIF